MQFDFANELKATNFIDIDNIGNFALEAINEEDGFYYYLLVKTALGAATIIHYGPIVPDVTRLPDNYSINFERLKFNDKKMALWINKWLNDKVKHITAAYIIEEAQFKGNYKDVKEYIENYGDDIY